MRRAGSHPRSARKKMMAYDARNRVQVSAGGQASVFADTGLEYEIYQSRLKEYFYAHTMPLQHANSERKCNNTP